MVVSVAVLTSGCGGFAGLSDVPLPGGPDLGDNPITVTIEAKDVLNLSRQATVKVDDVTVGEVDAITRIGWHADVRLRLRGDVDLPANATAAIRQTGLLGEKYVALAPPVGAEPIGVLESGARIGLERTTRSFEVEEVLGALSLLLNGGGIERIRTITTELNNALGGREQEFRTLLTKLNTFTGTLSANRRSILTAIEGLDRLSASAAVGRDAIARALDSLGPALQVLASQRRQLVQMLGATSELGKVSTDVVVRSRADLLANLRSLDPILANLAEAGDSIPGGLAYALTFPFSSKSLTALKGDYFNFDLEVSLSELGLSKLLGLQTGQIGESPATPPLGGLPIPALPQLPGLNLLGSTDEGEGTNLLALLLGGGH